MTIRVNIDGSARPNPGKGGIGVVIQGDGWDYTISETCPKKRVSNNMAEYMALERALIELMKYGLINHEIEILSDSEMLVLQMLGEKKVDKGAYVPEYMKAKQLRRYFSNLKFKWISRDLNSEANLLASKGVTNG